MSGLDIVTLVIIAINAIVSFKGFSDLAFFNKNKFQISSIQQGDKYRMFTSGFLHVDQMHLIFNMLTLYFFADAVIGLPAVLASREAPKEEKLLTLALSIILSEVDSYSN